MRILLAILCTVGAGAAAAAVTGPEARRERHADHVRIVRDTWGIAHIYGKSDADTVFGAIYAQAEDDFGRVERNYRLRRDYRRSPAWLKSLMEAWSDGLNYFLSKHPGIAPKVIHHFEPWMALSFTEGSIGGDIESVDLGKLRDFYAAQYRLCRCGRHDRLFSRKFHSQTRSEVRFRPSGRRQ